MPPMSLRELRPLLVLAVGGIALAAGHSAGHVDVQLLTLLPGLVLLLPLLAGRYVGEAGLRRLVTRRRTGPRRPRA